MNILHILHIVYHIYYAYTLYIMLFNTVHADTWRQTETRFHTQENAQMDRRTDAQSNIHKYTQNKSTRVHAKTSTQTPRDQTPQTHMHTRAHGTTTEEAHKEKHTQVET